MAPSPSDSNGWEQHKNLVEYRLTELAANQTLMDTRLVAIEKKLTFFEGARSVVSIFVAAVIAYVVSSISQ